MVETVKAIVHIRTRDVRSDSGGCSGQPVIRLLEPGEGNSGLGVFPCQRVNAENV